jgi:hypothetical protein
MRSKLYLLAILAFCMVLSSACFAQGKLVLVQNGQSNYQIVIPQAADPTEKKAAYELRSYLNKMSGASLTVVTDDAVPTAHEIVIGKNRHLDYLPTHIDFKKLGNEGFTIRTIGNNVVIAGGPKRGTAYGVYTFLESYLGVRWWTPAVEYVPAKPTIEIGAINDTQVPKFDVRLDYCADAMELNYFMHHKMNGWVIGDERGGIFGAHTYFTFLPPDKYFKDHPEYYSLLGGKRQPIQLCLTNPDVLKITEEWIRKAIKENPKATHYVIGQMDSGDACDCENCKPINDREGTQMGTMMLFANKIAAEFPDKTFMVCAYWGTVHPPKTIKPAPNVGVTYCTYGERQVPFTAPQNADSRKDIETWYKLVKEMRIWDYLVRYSDTQSPFPNWRTLQPNMQYLVSQGALGMFAELSGYSGGELCELRSYVLAKLMWNADCDYNAEMNDFLNGYYGAAKPSIRKYLDQICDAAEAAKIPVITNGWFGNHRDGYLSPANVANYSAAFDEAEKAVAGQPEVLARVQRARLPIIFTQIVLGYGDIDTRITLANRFDEIARKTNTMYMNDSGSSRQGFVDWIKGVLQNEKNAQK